tara:strand:- start:1191 stop:1658 length:468 start_codon:yes stop_codon:yes gene_type:complete
MDMYGSSTQVMQPMPGYYNQYPIQGSNYQPYQPPQAEAAAEPAAEPAQAVQQTQAQGQGQAQGHGQWQAEGQGQGQSPWANYFGYDGQQNATPYSTMPVGAPSYMPTTRPPELQQSYAQPQTRMPILDQASAGFGGYSQTPRFNFGQGFNFGGSM